MAPRRIQTGTLAPTCDSQCRVDADCPQLEKCCFNGCGLMCSGGRVNNGNVVVPKTGVKPSLMNGVSGENKGKSGIFGKLFRVVF